MTYTSIYRIFYGEYWVDGAGEDAKIDKYWFAYTILTDSQP
jgi:hypothetical protein